jgi:hypothetical protein
MKKADESQPFLLSLAPENMAQLMVFLTTEQYAGKYIVDFATVAIRQANHHLGEKVRVRS